MTKKRHTEAASERLQAAISAAEAVLEQGMSLDDAICAALYVAGGSTEPWAWAADFTAVGSGMLFTREPTVATAWKKTAQETEQSLGKKCAVIPLYISSSNL